MSIGDNIKRAREAAGITTQLAMAEKLGVPQPQLSDWENDRYDTLDLKSLLRIAAAIPCELDALVVGVDDNYDRERQNAQRADAAPEQSSLENAEGTRKTQGQDRVLGGADPSLPTAQIVRDAVQALQNATTHINGLADSLAQQIGVFTVPTARRKAPKTRRALSREPRRRRTRRG